MVASKLGSGRRRLAGGALLAALLAAVPARAAPPRDLPCPCGRAGYALAFDDEFDALSLQRDGGPGRWSTTADGVNAFRVGNRTLPHEEELYTDADAARALGLPPENLPFSVRDGVLRITAAPLPASARIATALSYSSGLLITRRSFLFRYGYVEVRARIPSGRGLWPAIWLFRPDSTYGEIDIMENLGQEPGRAYSSIHFFVDAAAGGPRIDQLLVGERRGPSLADGFHTYAVDWTADEVRFLIDGAETGRTPTRAALNGPMYLLLNLAVGGVGSWPGPVGPDTAFPASFDVDYARIWTAAGPGGGQPPKAP